MRDFMEDPLYLSKNTNAFVICNPNNLIQMKSKETIVNQLRTFGYEPSIQYYVSVDKINNSDEELGFNLPVKKEVIGVDGVQQWYTFMNVLRKARILKEHFIVCFDDSEFRRDIPLKCLQFNSLYFHKGILLMNDISADKFIRRNQLKVNSTNGSNDLHNMIPKDIIEYYKHGDPIL